MQTNRWTTARRTTPFRVLIVDDEDGVRQFVGAALSQAGYETLIASSGPEALRMAKKEPRVDLLLTDVMMPEMRGDELARRMRSDDPEVKVLYFSGFRDLLFAERPSHWEDEAFLDKPCSVVSLLKAVQDMCGAETAKPMRL
jgi:two-component system cell cycle sensor histidine kinase/response regulator CckA